MSLLTAMRYVGLMTCFSLAAALVPATAPAAPDPPPEVSPDGLRLTKSTRNRVVCG